ncbi:lipase class 3 family protein [Thecamonas trahens ATCC 50062]|uniref:Lipase class 3 family protein n=1 Tax=Thecamonas trahens ATCC 50062 TaxID=461836 RepID=A0A0L0D9S2_THETB|nr:lipase class 3 family protein [Thecamonas trahens ATCC 50062]KNC48048.1 lipase class 3 family protein [Thecamonas trahens ATCC 50062]|eukprot:XP_013759063.1 lipase class 3 family protein [Thecamonas trahens ATCC 50062]
MGHNAESQRGSTEVVGSGKAKEDVESVRADNSVETDNSVDQDMLENSTTTMMPMAGDTDTSPMPAPVPPTSSSSTDAGGWLRWVASLGVAESTKAVASLLLATYSELGEWSLTDLAVGLSYLQAENTAKWRPPSTDRAFLHRELIDVGMHYALLAQAAYARSPAEWRQLMAPLALSRLPTSPESAASPVDAVAGFELIKLEPKSTLLRPGYFIAVDHTRLEIVLAIRGTDNNLDLLTDCCACGVPFEDGGFVHSGMHRAALWFLHSELATLVELLVGDPRRHITLVGHSLGGGTAALLAALLRPHDEHVHAFALGPPPCADLATSIAFDLSGVCTSFVCNNDIVPRASLSALEHLRREIKAFPWWERAKADMLASPWLAPPVAAVSSVAAVLPDIQPPAQLVAASSSVWNASVATMSTLAAWLRPTSVAVGVAEPDPFHVETSALDARIDLVPPGKLYHVFRDDAGDLSPNQHGRLHL